MSLLFLRSHMLASAQSEIKSASFIGEEHWSSDDLSSCESLGAENASLSCYSRVIKYQRLHLEVLNEDPILLVFRDFITEQDINVFLEEIRQDEQLPLQVVDTEPESLAYKDDTHRRANGSFIQHYAFTGVSRIFRHAKAMLPFLNLDNSESWQILSYQPGGHYTPHTDYIIYTSEKQWDDLTKKWGNRFATFLLVLQSAEEGGGTVFPKLNKTVRVSPGDAIFWTNMNADGEVVNSTTSNLQRFKKPYSTMHV
ncbi:unnamed protein product [Heligmosomoides polygyrus]|uniref:Fe2OG dioxygenase domain-containing protein n=1 Tax=Heligmosomoides polygyrus TaxID=6339 RepID=A0A183F1T4_HELPZ|nr:unnamed protein product [Heligmosomoides polygyrus]